MRTVRVMQPKPPDLAASEAPPNYNVAVPFYDRLADFLPFPITRIRPPTEVYEYVNGAERPVTSRPVLGQTYRIFGPIPYLCVSRAHILEFFGRRRKWMLRVRASGTAYDLIEDHRVTINVNVEEDFTLPFTDERLLPHGHPVTFSKTINFTSFIQLQISVSMALVLSGDALRPANLTQSGNAVVPVPQDYPQVLWWPYYRRMFLQPRISATLSHFGLTNPETNNGVERFISVGGPPLLGEPITQFISFAPFSVPSTTSQTEMNDTPDGGPLLSVTFSTLGIFTPTSGGFFPFNDAHGPVWDANTGAQLLSPLPTTM